VRRPLLTACVAITLTAGPVVAQTIRPRSSDYLFVATADDVRATWINPAGLAVVREASVMGELVVDRPADGDARLGQWTVGINSRGFSIAFQQNRFADGTSNNIWHFGVGLGFTRGALGGTVGWFTGEGDNSRGGDIGFYYLLASPLSAAVVVRNIGRPVLRDSILPINGAVGLGWLPVPNHLQIAAEVIITEETEFSDVEAVYRAGLQVATAGKLPIGAVTTFDLGSNFKIDRWSIGITVGGDNRGILLGTAQPSRFDRFSLTGVASRRPPSARP
jgi:hypothetical protein